MTVLSKDAAFWSKISRKYAANPIRDMDGYLNTLERTKSYLKPSDTVLEIGCGTGATALLLAPLVKHFTASDVAPGMIEIADERLAKTDAENVTFKVAEIRAHSAQDEAYDVVLAHNLLHLVPELDSALEHIAALVKPGGLFISKTVCIGPQSTLKQWAITRLALPIMQALGKAPSVCFVSAKDLEERLERAGLKVVEAEDQDGILPSRYIVARKGQTRSVAL